MSEFADLAGQCAEEALSSDHYAETRELFRNIIAALRKAEKLEAFAQWINETIAESPWDSELSREMRQKAQEALK